MNKIFFRYFIAFIKFFLISNGYSKKKLKSLSVNVNNKNISSVSNHNKKNNNINTKKIIIKSPEKNNKIKDIQSSNIKEKSNHQPSKDLQKKDNLNKAIKIIKKKQNNQKPIINHHRINNSSNKNPLKKNLVNQIINKNNNEVMVDLVEEDSDDVFKAYALPKITEDNNTTIIEDNKPSNMNQSYESNYQLKEVAVNEISLSKNNVPKIIPSVNKGENVQRNIKKNVVMEFPDYYEEVNEGGKILKRSFTIEENQTITKFLIKNGINEDKAEAINSAVLKSNNNIKSLNKGQYVIIFLEKSLQYFKQHKVDINNPYQLKKLIVFFDNGVVIFKIKKGLLVQKKIYHNQEYKDFFIININTIEEVNKLMTLQPYCSEKQYEFLTQTLDFFINKFDKQNITIKSIKLIIQQTLKNNKIKKKIPSIIICTNDKLYHCYLYKDFADNYHLLNADGNSFNYDTLDLKKNSPLDGRITSLFGNRHHPVLKRQKHHNGIDIAAPAYTPVFTALNGWVLSVGIHKTYGNYIIMSYGNSLFTLYGHLNKVFVNIGEYVESGKLIGAVGSTGRSTGPHLHYEIFTSDVNFFSISDKKIQLLFGNRNILDPGEKYKIFRGIRLPELPYFSNLRKFIDIYIKDKL